jgi:hypothetical protein
MESITLAVSRASNGANYAVELFRWHGGARDQNPAAKSSLPAALFGSGGALDLEARQRFFLETTSQDTEFRAIGRQIWDSLHAGDVAAAWDQAIHDVEDALEQWEALSAADKLATPRPAGLRTYLQIDESLAALPWELLRSTHDLFLVGHMPVLRAEKRKFLPRGDAGVWPIRVLVVAGANAAEADVLKTDEELEAIREVFRESEHLFDINILETRRYETFTPADLKSELQSFRPHVFHFIGHGRTDGHIPRLEICDRKNKQDWTSTQIELDLKNMGSVLRLAFLNACRTGQPKKSDFFSIGQAFFRGRTLAVLAMQADVSGQAARTCTRRFYSELVNGSHVDAALAAARDMVNAEMGEDTRHAFVPVLSVSAAPEHIFECPRRTPIQAHGLDEVRRHFVDRIDERRIVIHSVARSEIVKQHCSAIVLKGQEEKIGKTWLQMWLLHAFAQQNYSIHTVEAFDKSDWLQFVLALCEGAPAFGAFYQPLPEATRRQFYEDAARIAGQPPPAPGAPPAFHLDDFASRNDAHEKVLAAFHQALRDQPKTKPVILAASRFSTGLQSLSSAHVRTLKEHLWDRIAAERDGAIMTIIELPFDSHREYQFEFAEDLWQVIDLARFSARKVPELLREFFYRLKPGKPLPARLAELHEYARDVRPDRIKEIVEVLEDISP